MKTVFTEGNFLQHIELGIGSRCSGAAEGFEHLGQFFLAVEVLAGRVFGSKSSRHHVAVIDEIVSVFLAQNTVEDGEVAIEACDVGERLGKFAGVFHVNGL